MTFDNDGGNEIRGIAAAINSRLAAESRIARAIAFGWLCAGAAIGLCFAGLGCAFGFVGYSHMISVKPSAELTARALVEAFERTKLKTVVVGSMSLAHDSELKLAASQTVHLSEGAIVKLDPSSSVRIVGNLKVDVPQPSKQQLQLDATSKTDELPFTNYTIFRDVNYEKGHVVTGWHYDLSDTARPKTQVCYYQQSVERGLSAKYTLAINNSPQRPSALTKVSFNFDGALANCIWFSGY
jgi:hypothetical protein